MSKIKNEMATRCELALMGKVVDVNSNDELQAMTEYILGALDKSEEYEDLDIVEEKICRYSDKNIATHLVVNTLMGGQFRCITYCIDTQEEDEPKPFEEDYGTSCKCAFSYVFNVDADELSEFGDCFFKKHEDGFYHRVS